jgi:cob(I)alamin adenosyltransferase
LTNKLTQLQASIFDLNLKISTAQTEKAYTEDERKQLLIKIEGYNSEVKRLRGIEK